MDLEGASVAMLYQDPHPAHRGFAESIGADLVDFRGYAPEFLGDGMPADLVNGLQAPGYDVYLVEGSRPLYAALINRTIKGSRLVYLCADHGLYSLGKGGFRGSSALKTMIGRFGRPVVRRIARRYVDGVIAVSEFAAEFTRPIVGEATPIEVAHPYVQPDVFEALGEVSPALEGEVAVTVGRADWYKGIDLLVDAWPTVRRKHPGAELHVVGTGHPERYNETPGVRVRGYVPDLADALAPACVYVQPSRMDTFPVSVLEAMRAGLPPIVTETTGTRSDVREIDSTMVVAAETNSIAEAVSAYYDCDDEERRRRSQLARERGATFDEATRTDEFAAAFRSVLEAL